LAGGQKISQSFQNKWLPKLPYGCKGDLHRTSKKYNFYLKSFEIVGNTRHKTEKPLPKELKQVKYAIPDETMCLLLANHYPEGI
jgi:hypothetical protein